MQRRARWLLTLLLVAASLAAFPQTNTRITLNVVAFDNHDQIVRDLTSQDFQVSDQGKPQRIVSFHQEPQPTPNNVPPVVILFDLLSDNLSHRGHATEEIIHALEHLERSDSLYLYLLSDQGQLKRVRGLPDDPPEHDLPEKTPWTEHIKPLLDAAIENAYGLRVAQGLGTLSAIEALGAALKPFPGRKNLIWMGDMPVGGPVVTNASCETFECRATTLDRDGVTVSSVDQGAIVGYGVVDQFAQLTGGQVYANDIEKAVKEAMAASSGL
jgi:VWFA-related protein